MSRATPMSGWCPCLGSAHDCLKNRSGGWNCCWSKPCWRHSELDGKRLEGHLTTSKQCKSPGVGYQPFRLNCQPQVAVKGSPGAGPGLIADTKSRALVGAEDATALKRLCVEGSLEKAVDALLRLDQLGTVPTVQIYGDILQVCIRKKALAETKQVQACMAKTGLDSHRFLGESLVKALAKCGDLEGALKVFHGLQSRTVFSWTAVISGLTRSGNSRQALQMYEQMQREGVKPNKYTFIAALGACGSLVDLDAGKQIHAQAVSQKCESDVFVGTSLVDMYVKCGSLVDARQVFDTMSEPNTVSWNAMLAGYAYNDQGGKALELFDKMESVGISPDAWTFVSALKACSCLAEKEVADGLSVKQESLRKGMAIHSEAASRGYDSDTFVGNTLVSMYAKCGSLGDAQRIFDTLSKRDVVSWNAILGAYVQQQQEDKALLLYDKMQDERVKPDVFTFVIVLKACSNLAGREDNCLPDGHSRKGELLQRGRAMHTEATARGYGADGFLGSTLVSMYAKCGSLLEAQSVFDKLPQRDVVLWNSMLGGCAQHDDGERALELYKKMQDAGVTPNDRTFVSVLQACGCIAEREESTTVEGQSLKTEALRQSKAVHAEAASMGYESDIYVASTLVSMYAKCGSMKDAHEVFDRLPCRTSISWNAILAGYADQGQGEKALELYTQMQQEGVRPDKATFLGLLKACSHTGALNKCIQIHHEIEESGYGGSLGVGTSLIDAYGRCGSMLDAKAVFDSLSQPDLVAWNALLAGYTRQGEWDMGLQCFANLCGSGTKPDGVTFLLLLSVCGHAGMVDKGLEYFRSMSTIHGLTPAVEHYACMVDLFGRAGLLSKAEELISEMPMEPSWCIWFSLLGACCKHGNVSLARRAFDGLVQLVPHQSAAYVLMYNTYAQAGMWDAAKEIDDSRKKAGAWKQPGQSWLEHRKEVHTFTVGDERHRQIEKVRRLLKELSLDLKDDPLSDIDWTNEGGVKKLAAA